jgi:hypothetical protein
MHRISPHISFVAANTATMFYGTTRVEIVSPRPGEDEDRVRIRPLMTTHSMRVLSSQIHRWSKENNAKTTKLWLSVGVYWKQRGFEECTEVQMQKINITVCL